MGRIDDWLGARIIISEHSCNQIRRRCAHAIEQSQRAIGMTKQAQHGHHAINGLNELGRYSNATRHKGLTQRQKIDQQINENLWIAADMTAIGQNLAPQFLSEPFE